ncbi:MAG: serine hydrolase [Balneolaceae bacterium]|nr:serine hydrolase [Balneolaceae bacterium]
MIVIHWRFLIVLVSILLTDGAQQLWAQSPPLHKREEALPEIIKTADNISSVRSLLIQQHGKLICEEYFDGRDPKRAFNIKSASKSIISLLVGIALEEKLIPSIDETLGNYFPEYFKTTSNPKKENITIRQMLSMQTGLETTSFYNYGAWVISDDWIEFQLNQPFVEEIGGKMVYSTGTSHLLSVIIARASGMSTRQFANQYLFKPLDIRIGGWDKDPNGYYMGGNNLAMKPSDMLKIGQMILNGGTYNGQHIISSDWLAASFSTYTRSNFNPYNYGYMWWNKKAGDYTLYFAWGFGGQYIFIIPQLDAVVVLTSSLASATQRRSYKKPVFNLIETYIIPLLDNMPENDY